MANYVVVYTDGGTRPNPGDTGSAFVGYVYDDNGINKRRKIDNQLVTASGFTTDTKAKDPVQPFEFIIGLQPDTGTNNTAELLALLIALRTFEEYEPISILIKADSKYVIGKVEKAYETNYQLAEQDRSNVNMIALYSLLKKYKEKGTIVKMEHVYGHQDSFGNNKADELATLAIFMKKEFNDNRPRISKMGKSLYNKDIKRHPFLTGVNSVMVMEEPVYSNGNLILKVLQYKDQADTGKPSADAIYAYISLSEDDELLRRIFNQYFRVTNTIVPIMIDIQQVYKDPVSTYLKEYGELSVYVVNNYIQPRKILVGNTIVGSELFPRGLSIKTYEQLEGYYSILHLVEKGLAEVHDIKDILYDENGLRKTIGTNAKMITTKLKIDGRLRSRKLVLGLDLPTRNTLKKIEKQVKEVSVIVRQDTKKIFSIFTYIELEDGSYSIWGNPYKNKVVIS